MLPSWANDSITIIRPSTATSRGSTILDWDNPTKTTAVSGCSVQPAATSLNEDGRVLGIMEGLTAYLPPGTDVQAGDHVTYDGDTYEINGEPKVWTSPTGMRSHILLSLRRYSG